MVGPGEVIVLACLSYYVSKTRLTLYALPSQLKDNWLVLELVNANPLVQAHQQKQAAEEHLKMYGWAEIQGMISVHPVTMEIVISNEPQLIPHIIVSDTYEMYEIIVID